MKMPPEATPSIEYIDGPMLPHLLQGSTVTYDDIPRSTTSLVPTITPPLAHAAHTNNEGEIDAQQYLLVPNPQRIIVMSAHHGKRVCTLVPEGNQSIHALALVWLPLRGEENDSKDGEPEEHDEVEEEDRGEWVVIAGCSDGSLQEWVANDFAAKTEEELAPRRIFKLTSSNAGSVNVIHLCSPTESNAMLASSLFNIRGGAPLYGLINAAETGSKKTITWVVSCLIPPFDKSGGDDQNKVLIELNYLVSTKVVKSTKEQAQLQKSHVCLKHGDSIFGLKAAYRPSSAAGSTGRTDYVVEDERGTNGASSNGDVFLVICASRGFAIYQDYANSLASKDDNSGMIVHFKLPMKSSYQSKEMAAFSSIAISPDAKNLALGRASGHIEILDNVFYNVAKFLKSHSTSQDNEHHPEVVTVRKSVHWHANPVRALAFLADSGRHRGNSGSVISGGEESVLVTWQLDRDFHRPSHFVSRVGQGGILHTLCCMHTSKIIVFCSDNSVQCYHGSNYDRLWMEQGIASMKLHEESIIKGKEEGDTFKKGSIIMQKDPITGFPILSNLPGAPGMVHWYDPKAASVVGTLEVSPYNRVSRRDPLVDPNIPAPAVTHVALGHDGKDLITVDTVWSENTSVGKVYDLVGPKGDKTPMSVYTSIKFFSFSGTAKGRKPDQRKHRRGDLSVSYELVSSMASPHGREGEVCALAVSPNGDTACTLSRQEDAFRIWSKKTTYSQAGVASVMWKCLYKVKTPAGFANLLSDNTGSSPGQHVVEFSSDGSVLSVCYGTHITLWDHTNATLLNSLTSNGMNIQHVHFLTRDDDYLLLSSETEIAIKSPFGGSGQSSYLGNDEWSVDMTAFGKHVKVSSVVPFGKKSALGAQGFYAVCVVIDNGLESVVMIVNRSECGVACVKGTDKLMYWRIKGEVSSLCVNECIDTGVELLAITEDCRLLSLHVGTQKTKHTLGSKSKSTSITRAQAPVLQVGYEVDSQPTKRRKVSTFAKERGKSEQQLAAGFEFPPSLNSKFTASFLSGKMIDWQGSK